MEGSWQQPASRMVRPRGSLLELSEETIEAREEREYIEADAKHQQRLQEYQDKIGALFGGKWFISNWTNPILLPPQGLQLSVSRFYPDVFVAVDIFKTMGDLERKMIAFKRTQFKDNIIEHGGKKGRVRYGALSYADQLAALLIQLED